MTEDQGAQTKTEVIIKRLRIERTNFCHQLHIQVWLRRLYYSLAKPDLCFSFKSLALQDYNNKAPDDEPATVPW